jgi:hypothetical protein
MLSKLEEKRSSRKPYPMSWDEQSILFGALPAHLQTMALFKVNTGCREQEVGPLIEAANKVSATDSRGPVLTILKRRQA